MQASIKLLSAITLASSSLFSAQAASAQAAPMAFECFDRSSGELMARSAADITTPSLSCLPIPEQAFYPNPEPPIEDVNGQALAEPNVEVNPAQNGGPGIGEIILGAAVQEGFRAIFGTYDRGDITNTTTEIHNGDRCDGMGTICGNGNGVGDVGSGNASNSGNTSNSGNIVGNSRTDLAIFPTIPTKSIHPSLTPKTIKAIQNFKPKSKSKSKQKKKITKLSQKNTKVIQNFKPKHKSQAKTSKNKAVTTVPSARLLNFSLK